MADEKKMKGRILSIDCAVSNGSVVLLQGFEVLASTSDLESSPSRAEEILEVVSSILSLGKSSLNELDGIAVSVGPGSYSGVRIGLATASGLSAALSIPSFGASVLDALSLEAEFPGKFVVAVAVGKRHIGWSTVEPTDDRGQVLTNPVMQSDAEFGDQLSSIGSCSVVCDRSLSQRIEAIAPERARVVPSSRTIAELIGRFVLLHPERLSLRPIYLQDQLGVSGQPVI